MLRQNIHDLLAFLVVAREGNFTKAAAQLGISQSALSHSVRALEERMGLRLLTRTTRKVVPTELGEQIAAALTPHVSAMEQELAEIIERRDLPSGSIRITATESVARLLLVPKILPFLEKYPDIRVEIDIDYGFTDIVGERYDAGVRLGELLAKDMIAVRIGPDVRMVVVGSPTYFERHPIPETPSDLTDHNCINLRLPSSNTIYAWEFSEQGREFKIRVDGQLTFNTPTQVVQAVTKGFGLGYLLEDHVEESIADGSLVTVLDEFSPPFPGFYLYYPNRRHHTRAFSLLIEALRYKD